MAYQDPMPPVTDSHRQHAYIIIRPAGRSYSAAMADPMLARVIEAKAHALRTADWLRTQQRTVVPVKRVRLGSDGHPMAWCTQMAPGPLVRISQPDIFTTTP
jgi:hypothetical protein